MKANRTFCHFNHHLKYDHKWSIESWKNWGFNKKKFYNKYYMRCSPLMSVRLWNFKEESTCSKDFFKQSYNELWFVKKCQNRTFKVNFGCQKLIEFFQKKILSKNINLGDHYLLKTFFSKLNFWTTLLSKITPNFWQFVITRRNFLKIIPWWHVDSWPKSLLFRIHHLWNSTTELILLFTI